MSEIKLDIPDITVLIDKGDEYKVIVNKPGSVVKNITGSYITVADSALTSSYALTASYVAGGEIATASYALAANTAITASYALNVPETASYAISASHTINSDNALSASYVNPSGLPSGVISSSTQVVQSLPTNTISSSGQVDITSTTGYTTFSSSIATKNNSQDAAIAALSGVTGSYATTGSNIFNGNQTIFGTLEIDTGNIVVTSGNSLIVSGAIFAQNEFVGGFVSASSIEAFDISGSFRGDGSQLTGLVTTLRITGSDASTDSISLLSNGLTLAGGNGVTTNVVNDTVTISIPSGVVSSSTQVTQLLPVNTVSSSGQVDITSTTGYTTFSSSVAVKNGSQDAAIAALIGVTGSYATTGSNIFNGNQTITGSLDVILPGESAFGYNENPTSNNVFWSYPPNDTNTQAVQVGWTAQVQGGGTYTVTNVQPNTPFAPLIAITLSDPSLALGYRVVVNFTKDASRLTFNQDGLVVTGSVIVGGRLTAQEFYTELVSSSIIYESGSTKFGDSPDDTHQFTGSLSVQGTISGSLILPANTVSSSTQVLNYNLFATTGSNTFVGQQKITGSIDTTTSVKSREFVLNAGEVSVVFTGSVTSGIFGATEYVHPFIPTSSFMAASVEYVAMRQGALRVGNLMSGWSGSTIMMTDVSTTDIGDTSDIRFAFIQNDGYVKLRVESVGSGSYAWTVQSLFKLFPTLP